jgi:hypothetical protein
MYSRMLGLGLAVFVFAVGAQAQDAEKAEINIVNERNEAVVMRFEYAFRQYTWKLIEHTIDAQDDVTYRYPSDIPGCERLREWRITDGLLTISNAKGALCQKRISLCDKYTSKMDVSQTTCTWSVAR